MSAKHPSILATTKCQSVSGEEGTPPCIAANANPSKKSRHLNGKPIPSAPLRIRSIGIEESTRGIERARSERGPAHNLLLHALDGMVQALPLVTPSVLHHTLHLAWAVATHEAHSQGKSEAWFPANIRSTLVCVVPGFVSFLSFQRESPPCILKCDLSFLMVLPLGQRPLFLPRGRGSRFGIGIWFWDFAGLSVSTLRHYSRNSWYGNSACRCCQAPRH